eukprot:scaffold68956_cov19-Tisochrysis_lutea.AAC.1
MARLRCSASLCSFLVTTGAEDGEVKVWNFSSGACLCTLQPKTQEEVTAILGIRGSFMKHFLVAGWDRR